MNVEFTTKFYSNGNGDTRVHVPALIVKAMELENGDILSVDCIDDQIIIKKKTEGKK